MSTLRNDLEQADSPLTSFIPGVPWPHVDPDAYGADVRKDWVRGECVWFIGAAIVHLSRTIICFVYCQTKSTHRSVTVIKYLLGFTRSPEDRTLYNAARPFRVIGGVSDQGEYRVVWSKMRRLA